MSYRYYPEELFSSKIRNLLTINFFMLCKTGYFFVTKSAKNQYQNCGTLAFPNIIFCTEEVYCQYNWTVLVV